MKLQGWVTAVELVGLPEIRKRPGFHDEPLRGARNGQRSVRLNRSYRLIYIEFSGSEITVVQILEISKHAY